MQVLFLRNFRNNCDKNSQNKTLYEKGKEYLNTVLFNGKYFTQKIDVTDISYILPFIESDEQLFDKYWNDETGEIKYQIVDGCSIDQVLAQWHADIIGLGEIFKKDKEKGRQKNFHFKQRLECFSVKR